VAEIYAFNKNSIKNKVAVGGVWELRREMFPVPQLVSFMYVNTQLEKE
jgi:hypothetical protein